MKPARAALYVRISDDRAGEAAGVRDQETDARVLAGKLGWGIGPVVVENDTSAFKRRTVTLPDGRKAKRVVRPGFRRLLDMLESGDADGMLAYDLDRTARDPRDLEDLIDVVESKRVPVESVTGSLKLATDADVTMARVMVAVANKSSRDTARRTARKHETLAAEGKPGGGGARRYGFERDQMTLIEDEASVVREMAARILDGQSLNAVAAELNRRGVPTVAGGQWQSKSVTSIVTGPRVAGLRVFRGKVTGEATWPAILDRDTWEQVCATLAGRRGGANVLIRWLTGVLRCSLCERELTGWQGATKGATRYWCATPRGGCGKISVRAAAVEDELEAQILDYLEHPKVLERLRSAVSAHQLGDLRSDVADDEAQLKVLAGMWARREIILAEYTEARRIIEERLNASRSVLKAAAPPAVRKLLSAETVRAGWAELDAFGKRDVTLAVLAGYWVYPHDRSRGPRFDPDRLVPIPYDD